MNWATIFCLARNRMIVSSEFYIHECNQLQLELSGNFCIQFGKLVFFMDIILSHQENTIVYWWLWRWWLYWFDIAGLPGPQGVKYEGTWHEVSCRIASKPTINDEDCHDLEISFQTMNIDISMIQEHLFLAAEKKSWIVWGRKSHLETAQIQQQVSWRLWDPPPQSTSSSSSGTIWHATLALFTLIIITILAHLIQFPWSPPAQLWPTGIKWFLWSGNVPPPDPSTGNTTCPHPANIQI